MSSVEDAEWEQQLRMADKGHLIPSVAPRGKDKLGWFTVVCLVLNRTIGSGIFVNPSKVLEATGSAAGSLFLWSLGAVVSICGLLVFHDFGLSTPQESPQAPHPGNMDIVVLPRNGGDKNYFEFMLPNTEKHPRKRRLATCMYGIPFIFLGNLANNAIAFGRYAQLASGLSVEQVDESKGMTLAFAVAVLSGAVLVHMFSRRGGIYMSNIFAVLKVALLLFLIIYGGIKSKNSPAWSTPDPYLRGNAIPSSAIKHGAFDKIEYDTFGFGTWIDAFILIMYAYSGFEQPFYVLSEVRRPKETIPLWTVVAMLIAAVLFVLLNVVYLLVVPADNYFNANPTSDMATIFLQNLFPEHEQRARTAMAALIAVSIFGNIVVMTFTASRVKQEIAKEGILPFSRFFATSSATPHEWIKQRLFSNRTRASAYQLSQYRPSHPQDNTEESAAIDTPEQQENSEPRVDESPIRALFLHWLSSLLLIGVTAWLPTATAYLALSTLYTYVLTIGCGFFLSLALIYLNIFKRKDWHEHSYCTFKFFPWQAVVYVVAAGIVLVGAFIKPTGGSLFWSHNYFIVPVIGVSAITWGAVWFLGIRLIEWGTGKDLVVTRKIFPDWRDPDHPVFRAEVIDQKWVWRYRLSD